MILEKFSEFIYEQASLFLTRWRAFCFLSICLVHSQIVFEITSTTFWTGPISQGAQTLSKIFDLPVYLFCAIFILCFLVSPLLSKKCSLLILSIEYRRAENVIKTIEGKVTSISADSLILYRDQAIAGEQHIQRLRGLNESLVSLSIYGGANCFYSNASPLYYSIIIAVPLLFYFAVQSIFATYLKTIFFYKKLSEHFSTTIR